jgi:hypothetical protein
LLPGIDDERVATSIEFPVPDTGSADLVIVDAEGEISIVECKLRANPDIRRQVVGQVFAYAAGITALDYERFEAAFNRAAERPLIGQLGDESGDIEPLRSAISENLAAGRFRLIIAVDQITPELQRVVRYINQHTTGDVELLAIELRYIRHSDLEILLPEVYGEESAQSKQATSGRRKWDEQSLFDALELLCSDDGIRVARLLFDYLKERAVEMRWGVGKMPSVTLCVPIAGRPVGVVTVFAWEGSQGFIQFKFEHLAQSSLPREKLQQALERLREIPGTGALLADVETADFKKHPMIRIEPILTQPGAADSFIAAIDEILGPDA